MQVNNTGAVGSVGVRAMIITTPYPPVALAITRKENEGMKHFGDIAKAFNNHVLKLVQKKKIRNQNGLYLRTLMLFMAYANLSRDERTVQNAKGYLLNKLDFNANSATISRNNYVLYELGFLELIENPENAREKMVRFTPLGEEFARLMR